MILVAVLAHVCAMLVHGTRIRKFKRSQGPALAPQALGHPPGGADSKNSQATTQDKACTVLGWGWPPSLIIGWICFDRDCGPRPIRQMRGTARVLVQVKTLIGGQSGAIWTTIIQDLAVQPSAHR